MRLDSPVVLATAGTLAIHVLIAIMGDAVVVLHPIRAYERPPRVALVDVETVKTPPPPPKEEEQKPEPQDAPKQVPQAVQKTQPRRSAPPPPSNEPPPPSTSQDSGGSPVMTLDDAAANAVGTVPIAVGKMPSRPGRGGNGGGPGLGTGAGSSDAPPTPVSVATIKQRALPKGDFSYFDASKEYPADAKALAIEGVIRVRLVVDQDGKVKDMKLLNRLGHGLDELALERAKKIEFSPARDTDDKPVSSVVVWTFNMTLPK